MYRLPVFFTLPGLPVKDSHIRLRCDPSRHLPCSTPVTLSPSALAILVYPCSLPRILAHQKNLQGPALMPSLRCLLSVRESIRLDRAIPLLY